MTVTFATNPNQDIEASPKKFFGLSTDTKPTVASHSALPEPTKGSEFFETDTGNIYRTYDGTNWAKEIAAKLKKVSATKSLVGGAYTAKDVLSEYQTNGSGTVWTFSDVVPQNGGGGYIVRAQVISETTNLTAAISLFLYNAAPTCELDDNAASNAPLHADIASYIGRLDFPAMEQSTLSALGDSEAMIVPGAYQGLPLAFTCGSSVNDIYGVAVTRDAFTQGSYDDLTFVLMIDQA